MRHDGNSEAPQLVSVADTGVHEDFWRVDRPKRNNYLVCCDDLVRPIVVRELDRRSPVSADDQPSHRRTGEDCHVRAVQVRMNVGAIHGLPQPVSQCHVQERCAAAAVHHGAVVARIARDPQRASGLDDGRSDRIGVGRGRHGHGAPGAAGGDCRPVPILNATVDVKHRFIAPGFVTRLGCEVVPVASMSPSPHHHVDARPPAEHLPHRQQHRSALEMGARLRNETPVTLATQVQRPLRGIVDCRNIIGFTGLEQKHRNVRILRKPTGDDRSRRP